MKVVVDTNILITSLWKEAVFHSIIKKKAIELFSPSFALHELEKHAEEIIKRRNITLPAYREEILALKQNVSFIHFERYNSSIPTIRTQLTSFLPVEQRTLLLEDIDFLALSLALKAPLWSNDKLLKKQKSVIVLDTGDMIKLLA